MHKKTRLLTTLLATAALATALLCALPGTVLAAAGDTGVTDIWNWTELADGTLEVGMPTAPFSGSYILPNQLDIGQPGPPDIRDVTQIGEGAFMGSPGLTGMTLPPTLKVIRRYAFSGCTALTGITIPDSVTDIGESAFDGCTNLQTVTLPGNGSSHLASIGQNAFSECSSLESIAIPDTVTSIGTVAFINCTSLSSATLPNNPAFTAIPTSLFSGCSALQTVTIPATVTAIGEQSFVASGMSTFTIPPTVTTIGEQAFMGSALTAITIPSGVTTIGSMAFAACSSLTAITVSPANANYMSQAGVLYNISGTNLITCPGATAGVFHVPSGVSDIAEGAFFGCHNLTGVALANNVQTIGVMAFMMSGITDIQIPPNVTSIGTGAFFQCSSLSKVICLSRSAVFSPNVFASTGLSSGDGIYGFDGSTVQTYAANNLPAALPFHLLYTVSFQSEGSAVDDIIAEAGKTIASPADPTRSGFLFSRWCKDSGLTDPWDFATDTVTDDMTLYAQWTAAPTATPTATPTETPSATPTVTPIETTSPTDTPSPTDAPSLQLTMSPSSGKIFTGGRVTIEPSIPGGTWSFDSKLLSRDGNTFTGLKAGTARVTYTVGAQSVHADIVVAQAELPQTGQDFSLALWLLVLALTTGCAAAVLLARRRRNAQIQ